MVAEIKGTTSSVVAAAAQRNAASEATAVSNTAPAGTVSGENVHLTKAAAELRDLEQAVRAAPDVDLERVNSIRQAIAEGTYKVDEGKLAQNLLRYEMMMASGGGTRKS